MKKRILITGGAGFIGSHLARALVHAGYPVTVLDIKDPSEPIEKVIYHRGDVRKKEDLMALIPSQDAVVHFAAQVSVPECELDPIGSHEVNAGSTLQILDLVREENEKRPADQKMRIVFSSSSAVYGELGNSGKPISESNSLSAPLSFYGRQKLASEEAIRAHAKNHALPGIVFRFFNVYGLGQVASSPYSGVISLFTRAMREGTILRLNGGGVQTRDFISVHDVVRAISLSIESDHPQVLEGTAINLGTEKAISIRALAELLKKMTGKSNAIEVAQAREGDILHSCADISLAKTLLNWEPKVDLSEGLKELCS